MNFSKLILAVFSFAYVTSTGVVIASEEEGVYKGGKRKSARSTVVKKRGQKVGYDEDVAEKINLKATQLKVVLDKSKVHLEEISKKISERETTTLEPIYAIELAGVRTSVQGMIGSTHGILDNLNGDELLNKSLAIIASSALGREFLGLINYLKIKNVISGSGHTKMKNTFNSICAIAAIKDFPLEETDD